MTDWKRHLRLCLLVFAAVNLHLAYAERLEVGLARPNLALATLFVSTLFVSQEAATIYGFAVGLAEGAFVSAYLGSFVVSRVMASSAAGQLEQAVYRQSLGVAVVVVLLGTLLCELLFVLFVPREAAGAWALRSVASALYNAAFAMPLFLLARFAAGKQAGAIRP